MSPTFSNRRTNVAVSASIDADGVRVTEYDVRAALERVADDNGVTLGGLTVTVTPGERTVTMSESEYNALTAATPASDTSNASA